MKIAIKNMVCERCIMVVQSELEKLGFQPLQVSLGEAEFDHALNTDEKNQLNMALHALGFSIIEERKNQIAEQIKILIIDLIHHQKSEPDSNYSDYLSQKLFQDYKYLSTLFSELEGITIEKFIIAQKIERVKELLKYGELSLNQIAADMNYSSVAYLSSQFKKVTTMTPTQYKNTASADRNPLDKLKVS